MEATRAWFLGPSREAGDDNLSYTPQRPPHTPEEYAGTSASLGSDLDCGFRRIPGRPSARVALGRTTIREDE